MARPRNQITQLVDAAIDDVLNNGQWPAPDRIRAVLDLSPVSMGEALRAAEKEAQQKIGERLKARGFIISNVITHERKPFEDATAGDLEQQEFVKSRNHTHVTDHLRAFADVRALLEAEEARLGRPVTVSEIADDVTEVFEQHGVRPPARI